MPAPRHLIVPLAAVAALALPAPAMACDGADALPSAAGPEAVVATTVCLLNEQRAQQGLRPLTATPDLTAAARAHAGDMVTRGYFAHDAPDGTTLLDRLRGAGWLPASGFWTAGEDIAWGSSNLGTPGAIVNAWMNSAGHRANILQPTFDEVGVSIALGAPGTGVSGAATYVADFGARDGTRAGPAAPTPLSGPAPATTAPSMRAVAATRTRCSRAAKNIKRLTVRRAAVRRCIARAAARG